MADRGQHRLIRTEEGAQRLVQKNANMPNGPWCYMEWASYTRTLSMIGMSRTSDSASSRLSALRMQ